MIDATSIALIAGIATLVVERLFSYLGKIKKSSCMGGCCKMETELESDEKPVLTV